MTIPSNGEVLMSILNEYLVKETRRVEIARKASLRHNDNDYKDGFFTGRYDEAREALVRLTELIETIDSSALAA